MNNGMVKIRAGSRRFFLTDCPKITRPSREQDLINKIPWAQKSHKGMVQTNV